ncbi:MAG: hypothetical protein WCK82_10450 [Bacteroidota bacterium]
MILSFTFSCKKKGCYAIEGRTIIPFPHPFENYFSNLPKSATWKSNDGLTDGSLINSGIAWFPFENSSQDPVTCNELVGEQRIISYKQSLYSQNFEASITVRDNNELFLLVKIDFNDTTKNYTDTWHMLKRLDNDTVICRTFTSFGYFYVSSGYYVNSKASDFSTIDSIQVNNKTYKDVFHIVNREATRVGSSFSITEMFIDKFIGVVRYKLKNGQIWDLDNK